MNTVAAAMICTAVAGCGPSDNHQAKDNEASQADATPAVPATPPPPSPDELAERERPADQVAMEALLKKVDDADEARRDAANPIIADAAFKDAYNAYCSKMQNLDGVVLKNWIARVKSIFDSTGGDPPALSLETPGGIEYFQHIDTSSPFYEILLKLKEGDYVKFSMKDSEALEDAPGKTYQECDTQDYADGEGPHINRMLGGGSGDLISLTPLH
jgi:hypothetical protein